MCLDHFRKWSVIVATFSYPEQYKKTFSCVYVHTAHTYSSHTQSSVALLVKLCQAWVIGSIHVLLKHTSWTQRADVPLQNKYNTGIKTNEGCSLTYSLCLFKLCECYSLQIQMILHIETHRSSLLIKASPYMH